MSLRLLFFLCLWIVGGASGAFGDSGDTLRFVREGREVRRVDKATLREDCAVVEVRVPRDPYYATDRRYFACPLDAVLSAGFGVPRSDLLGASFFLRAADGYVRSAEGKQLLEGGAFLAIADADETIDTEPFQARWVPIDRRGLDPGPYYLVWTGAGQGDPHRYPWPFQLIEIEIAPFERDYGHTVPAAVGAGADTPAGRGFEIFRRECLSCHSINGEGGKVGPDLNIPRSIVEYRPAEQIKAYIRNPRSFRYTTMPAHPHLDDSDLDSLIAYFRAMSERKFDPSAEASKGEESE